MEEIPITKASLAAALARWESEAEAGNWVPRSDPSRHDDAAAYLIDIISKKV